MQNSGQLNRRGLTVVYDEGNIIIYFNNVTVVGNIQDRMVHFHQGV